MSKRELAQVMAGGHAIAINSDNDSIRDTMYRGISLGLPGFVDRLLWKTFRKTFHYDSQRGMLRGWNVRLEQHGIEAPSVPMLSRGGVPITFGHYHVLPGSGQRMPRPWNGGLFLDYGVARNKWLDIARWMRAPLVAVNRGSAELLLGWEFVQIGPLQFGTPSFWILEREGCLDSVVPEPGSATTND